MFHVLKALERLLCSGTASALWLFENLAAIGSRLPRSLQFAFVVLMMLIIGPVLGLTEPLRRFVVWISNGLYGVHATVTRDGIEIGDRRRRTKRHLAWSSIQSIVHDPATPPVTTLSTEDGEIEIDVVSEMLLLQESVRMNVPFTYSIDGVRIGLDEEAEVASATPEEQ